MEMKKDDEKSVASSDGKVENGMRTERSGDWGSWALHWDILINFPFPPANF